MPRRTENRQPTGLYKNAIEPIQLGMNPTRAPAPSRRRDRGQDCYLSSDQYSWTF
jgi:hypothetical protein